MSASQDRRGFLRGLASLPLIGGSVALIGAPTAVAARPTPDMLEAYKTWLHFEQRFLAWEMAADPVVQRRYLVEPKLLDTSEHVALTKRIESVYAFVGDSGSYHGPSAPEPSTRAALVLSAVGCDWKTA